MTIDLELIAPADPPTYLLAYDTDCDLMTDYAWNTASTIIQSSFDGPVWNSSGRATSRCMKRSGL